MSKEVVETLFREILNRNRLELLDEIISPQYKENNPAPGQLPGAEGIKSKLRKLRKAFPDLGFHLGDLVAEGDLVAARYYWEGTHRGEFLGIPATGKKVNVSGMDFYRVRDGRICEHWDSVDLFGLVQQLKKG